MYAPSQLAAALFLDDEALPPLCVLVRLLREHALRIADMQQRRVLVRAAEEAEKPELCSCRGVCPGLAALVRVLLEEGEQGEQFLNTFVAVLFGDGQGVWETEKRLRLARIVIEVLKKEAGTEVERLLKTWLKRAILPTRLADTKGGGDTDSVVRAILFSSFIYNNF